MISLARGILLGLGAAVPIGPVNVEIARRTLRGGFVGGVALGCGAVTVDVTYAALTSLSLMRFLDRPGLRLPLLIGGSLLLGYLGIMSLIGAAKAARQEQIVAEVSTTSIRRGYLTGLMMTAMNPMTLAFWLVAVPSAGASTSDKNLTLLCAGVFLGTFCWVLTFAGSLSFLRKFRVRGWTIAADLAGGLILILFAISGFFAAFHQVGIIR